MTDRRLLREFVVNALREVGENVPGGQPPPQQGLGGGINVASITLDDYGADDRNNFDNDTITAVGTFMARGEVDGSPFELLFQTRITQSEGVDVESDEDGRAVKTGWEDVTVDDDFDWKTLTVGGHVTNDGDLADEIFSHPTFDRAWKPLAKKIEKEFTSSSFFDTAADGRREGAAYAKDPYAYNSVKRSDFF